MFLGVDYYPEQWDDEMLDQDLDTIKEMGCNVIRIGEFAWHMMEPEEGKYDFSYFDRVIAAAKEKGISVIFGTPTATLPAWLAKKYPEVLSEFEDGRKHAFGGRRQYCFNSKVYREYCEKIIRELGKHYREEDTIVAWQLDNELGHEGSDECYCPNCQHAFQDFVRREYKGDIDKVNTIYGTRFWSQEYNDFDEIPYPFRTVTTHNPALRMDWEKFLNESATGFLAFTGDVLRSELKEDAVVFHDFPGGHLDKHYDFSRAALCIDKVAYNNYPVWGGQKEPIPPYEIAFNLDLCRGMKRQNFWITEAIMGAQGHDITGYLPRPNQAKMWSYQSMAHGCESIMYFRYRGAITGAEQFCYGIIDADNVKRRKYNEVKSFFEDISQYEEVLEHPMTSRIALIYDYESEASFRIQQQSILLSYRGEMLRYYKALYRNNVTVDIISSREDFSEYDVVITPVMIVWKEEFQNRVKEFVEKGGTAIMTFRTAVKDERNNLTFGKVLPVNYDEMVGAYVVETESVQEEFSIPIVGVGKYDGRKHKAGVFREMLVPTTAETLYRYGDQFYEEYSAVTKNRYGEGIVYYVGCAPDEDVINTVVDYVLAEKQIPTRILPEGMEVVRRESEKGIYDFYMNHTREAKVADGIAFGPYESKIIEVE